MDANIRIGKISGIPIELHWSWFLIFFLVTWSLATSFFPEEYSQLNPGLYWVLGVITSILFFGSVLAHELGHSLLAIASKIPVKNISLFIFGGVAQIQQEPKSPGTEFKVAIAGPLVSFLLAGIFYGIYLIDKPIEFLAAPSAWLARINLYLAAFNLIPGFPLDGGRVLRSIVWSITKDFQKATRVATFSGQVVAFGFIAIGIFQMFNGNFINGLWLAFIGWFLQNAAASAYAQVNTEKSLGKVKVSQVMEEDYNQIPVTMYLDRVVEEHILSGGHRFFMVTNLDRPVGILTLKDITRVPRAEWPSTTAGMVMIPWNQLIRVNKEDSLLSALQLMDTSRVSHAPVCDGDRVAGLLTREQVIHYFRTREELGM
jgi:Zn-dependent protease